VALITRYKVLLFSDKERFFKVSAMEKQVLKIDAEIFAITENSEITCMGQGIAEHYYKEQDRTDDKYKVKTIQKAISKSPLVGAQDDSELYDLHSLERKLKNLREMALSISREERQ
jgi:hypothetical protein